MTWLLWLYPPRWRRRYGEELAALVAAQRFSIGGALDLLAGAIDAWLHPGLALADPSDTSDASVSSHASVTSDAKGEMTMASPSMAARAMFFRCAGCGPVLTARDKRASMLIILIGSALLTPIWIWALYRLDNRYMDAMMPMAYLFPYLLSLPYSSLKGRSVRTQAILIAGLTLVLIGFFAFTAWIGTKI